eukprot:5424258-Lingulodinium_polyedra.AAC.1
MALCSLRARQAVAAATGNGAPALLAPPPALPACSASPANGPRHSASCASTWTSICRTSRTAAST